MSGFRLSEREIDVGVALRALDHPASGASVSFEGRVRDHNDGRCVRRLDYQAYPALAEAEGAAVIAEALARFDIRAAIAVHRVGELAIGDLAVWIGVGAGHRDAAFAACRWIIDEIKRRVPIWKNEHYVDGESGWLHPDNSPVDAHG